MGGTCRDKVVLGTLNLKLLMTTDHQVFHRHRLDRMYPGKGFDNEIIAPLIRLATLIKRLAQLPPQHECRDKKRNQNAQRNRNKHPTDHRNQAQEQNNERQVDDGPNRLTRIEITQHIQAIKALQM